MSRPGLSTAGRVAWVLVAVLAVAHWDFWYWDDRTLLGGFLPIGLAYHAVFSVVAAVVWWMVLRFAWPTHIEEWAADVEEPDDGGEPGS